MFNELCPILHRSAGYASVSISGQVYEVALVFNPIKIESLGPAGSAAGERQSAVPNERVDQAGFADIASPQKSDFRQTIGGELLGTTGASYKLR